jgi:hypothetical protein
MIQARFPESEEFKKWNMPTVAEKQSILAAASFSSRNLAAAFSASNRETSDVAVDMNLQ